MSEQLALQQVIGNRGTVDGDERPCGAWAGGMDGTRHHFLPGAGTLPPGVRWRGLGPHGQSSCTRQRWLGSAPPSWRAPPCASRRRGAGREHPRPNGEAAAADESRRRTARGAVAVRAPTVARREGAAATTGFARMGAAATPSSWRTVSGPPVQILQEMVAIQDRGNDVPPGRCHTAHGAAEVGHDFHRMPGGMRPSLERSECVGLALRCDSEDSERKRSRSHGTLPPHDALADVACGGVKRHGTPAGGRFDATGDLGEAPHGSLIWYGAFMIPAPLVVSCMPHAAISRRSRTTDSARYALGSSALPQIRSSLT